MFGVMPLVLNPGRSSLPVMFFFFFPILLCFYDRRNGGFSLLFLWFGEDERLDTASAYQTARRGFVRIHDMSLF